MRARLKAVTGLSFLNTDTKHPNSIAVFLTDGRIKFTLPDGKSEERDVKAGQSVWNIAGKHQPENLGDRPFEVVLIEMKTK